MCILEDIIVQNYELGESAEEIQKGFLLSRLRKSSAWSNLPDNPGVNSRSREGFAI